MKIGIESIKTFNDSNRRQDGRVKRLWITWEKHRRTSGLVAALPDVKLFQLEFEAHGLIRYPYFFFKTSLILASKRPELLIVQNPSVVLALFASTLGRLFTSHVVIDAHNEGLKPFYSKFNWLLPLYKFIQKRANLTIVTNKALADEVRMNGGMPFILEDKIPEFDAVNHVSLKGIYNLVFICTFEKDEPYQEVIRAAGLIDSSVCIYITGNYQKAPRDIIDKAPSNIIFTGFLSDQEYKNILYSSDIIIDLTSMENCLVCGAYEAVALEKPIIISDTQALLSYFQTGAVYTKNRAEAIAEAIKYAIENKEKLKVEMKILKDRLKSEWTDKFAKLVSSLDRGISNPG